MKKCPPGVICMSNISILIILAFFIIFSYLLLNLRENKNGTVVVKQEVKGETNSMMPRYPYYGMNYPYNNIRPDVLLNPYAPPLNDERYLVPINVSTNIGAVNTNYRQVGILTPINKKNNKDMILSLMGRPVYTNRNLWQYYTISNQHNNVKLPVIVKGKSGTSEYGVDKIDNNEIVFVEGYDTQFRTTVYDNNAISYLPFL